MCGNMVDIQSATAENRRGNKIEDRKKKPQGKKYNVRICYTQGGHKKSINEFSS